jgi:hypothetical protein
MSENIWSKKSIQKLIKLFPGGQFCITVGNKIVAVALALIVQYELTYKEITRLTPILIREMFCMESKFLLIQNFGNCDWRKDYTMREKNCAKN